MTPTTTRRALLAGTAAFLVSPASAQQVTTLKLYTLGYDVEATMLALEVSKRTEGRYRIETISGFDMLEAALGKEHTAGGEQALIEGAQSSTLDLVLQPRFTGAGPASPVAAAGALLVVASPARPV